MKHRHISVMIAALVVVGLISPFAAAAGDEAIYVKDGDRASGFFAWHGSGALQIDAVEGKFVLPGEGKKTPERDLIYLSGAASRVCDPVGATVITSSFGGMVIAGDGLVEFSRDGASMAGAVPVTFHEAVWTPKPGVDFDFACTFDTEPGSPSWHELFDLVGEATFEGPTTEISVTWTEARDRTEKPPKVTLVGSAEFSIDLDRDGDTESPETADVTDYDIGTLRDATLLPYGG